MKQFKNYGSQIKDLDEKGIVIVAANAIGNEDSDKDMSMDGSFDKTLSENFKRVKWFLNHDRNLLLGVPIEGKQSGKYLEMKGQLNLKKQIAKDTYEDYKLYAEHGKTLEHSIGVEAVKWEQKGDTRMVKEWKLWEYSTLTSWGANEYTPMLGMKSANSITEAIDWFNVMLKQGNYSDEKFLQIEEKINSLKSLFQEPGVPTQKKEPSRNWSLITTLINN
jgi:HK97 family phage prohead protease